MAVQVMAGITAAQVIGAPLAAALLQMDVRWGRWRRFVGFELPAATKCTLLHASRLAS